MNVRKKYPVKEGTMYGYSGGGVVKKELKSLKKGAETLKGKNIAKADAVEEDYETKKKSEVMAALKKRTLDKKTKNKIADDIVKKKGDTSKSDDRYAYESVKFDEAMSSYDKARKAAARRAADRNAARRRGEMGGRMERETYTSEGGKRMHYKGYTARDGE